MNIYEFDVPVALNGNQLKDELKAQDVYVREDKLVIFSELSESEVVKAIAAHKPIAPKEPTIDEKLASVGLSIDDLKAALGI